MAEYKEHRGDNQGARGLMLTRIDKVRILHVTLTLSDCQSEFIQGWIEFSARAKVKQLRSIRT